HHRGWLASEPWVVLSVEMLAGGINIGRVYELIDRIWLWLWRGEGHFRSHIDILFDFSLDRINFGFRGDAFRDEPGREGHDRIAPGIGIALFGRAVHHFVVRQGVRVRPNYGGVDHGRPLPRATMARRAAHGFVGSHRITPVHSFDEQVREVRHEFRDRA